MKKIGIISQLSDTNVNYGNRLQAYALNKYINENLNIHAESIILKQAEKRKNTKFSIPFILYKLIMGLKKKVKPSKKNSQIVYRESLCNKFMNDNIVMCNKKMTFKDLQKSDYDGFIVGSDVVWSQSNHSVNRIKFLDFNNKKNIKKISYAASFGKDYIPTQNISYIKQYLSSFDGIALREKSSVNMLRGLGIDNAVHTIDPTLLLSKKDWSELMQNPNIIEDKYIFVYLLGKDRKQRKFISNFAREKKLKIVNIIHANGIYNSIDDDFGDVKFSNCSPNNWLWLINNASYIFTDSFHGCVLSTIFEKNFFVLTREYSQDINNRMIDFLDTIKEEDKYVDINNVESLENYVWDYNKINTTLDEYIKYSKNYLKEVLNEET